MMMLARENGDRSTGSDNVDLFSTKQRKNIQKILKHIQKYSKIFGNSQKYSEILKNIQKYSKIFNRSVGPDNGSLLHRTNETPVIKCTPSSSHVRKVHHKKRRNFGQKSGLVLYSMSTYDVVSNLMHN